MAELIRGLDPAVVRQSLERVRAQISAEAPEPDRVQILAATKYLPVEELGALAEAGIVLVGENRAQDLVAKQAEHGSAFTWDFIGHLQSRKVRDLVGRVRYIQSVGSDSALDALARHGRPDTRVLIEVNVSGEEGKSGISPQQLPGFLERCPVAVAGLMTMPPLASDPEQSRRHFAALRELAVRHGLEELSMGTSQDYPVAVQEGATIVRLGSTLFKGPSAS